VTFQTEGQRVEDVTYSLYYRGIACNYS